jgi:hypothetical protein
MQFMAVNSCANNNRLGRSSVMKKLNYSVPQRKQISMCSFSYSKIRYCVDWYMSVSISQDLIA